ncbi:MAG: hypothetical protein A2499_02750 [Stygiobacter sp. RIFOXYC12_FULL_38_8]|nr:MAG: hypothetical protein A2299_10630 [Stygiobacter sp. RIFOXYB2_FULL_37_11]OGV11977.1 MAG: hypothetical protein A2237_15400 [Stygiobacter sp. RIFOXYA2_FULL_38_8]OGV14474.1 MAG: hypothetical protein A2440_08525 [Stygiobacter sp. RIFOXYC2_FULL_38_25]OGV27482.1 MAG: hypothetical protein A2499_02750 [Stygiobacter sp. RIFOXYC12_FULL_38_8]OGV82234.1 MAG: hypothetical protein A2X65_17880 [Stygiobacter sp. GWF2_38_21]RJQ57585.1 MAG: hypothetical protein C4517_17245 [Stygiobacter sp.]
MEVDNENRIPLRIVIDAMTYYSFHSATANPDTIFNHQVLENIKKRKRSCKLINSTNINF